MMACRLLPRPEIRTPSVRFIGHADLARAGGDLADHAGSGLAGTGPSRARTQSTSAGAQPRIRPIPMLNVAVHLVLGHAAGRPHEREERRHLPGGLVDPRLAALGEHARKVVGDAAAGDVRQRP